MTSFFFDQVCSKIGKGNAAWVKECRGLTDVREKMSDQEDSGVCIMSKDQGACFADKFKVLITGKIGSPKVVQKQEKPASQKAVVKPQEQKGAGNQKATVKPKAPKIKIPSPQLLVMKSAIHMMSPVRKTSNNGSSCKYEVMITKYIGKGNVCQEVSGLEDKIHQVAQGFNMMIYGEMAQFYRKSHDPQANAPKGDHTCNFTFMHSGVSLTIHGYNENVCQHLGKARNIEGQRNAQLKDLYGQKQQKIEKGMHKVTMQEEMDALSSGF